MIVSTPFKGIDTNFKISKKHYNEIKELCVETIENFLDCNLQSASASFQGGDHMELNFKTNELELRYKNLEFIVDIENLNSIRYNSNTTYPIHTRLYDSENYTSDLTINTMFKYFDTAMFNFWVKYIYSILSDFKEKLNYMIYCYEENLNENEEINYDTINDIYNICLNEYFD